MSDLHQLHFTDKAVKSPSETNQWLTCQQLWAYTKRFGLQGQDVVKGRKLASALNTMFNHQQPRYARDPDYAIEHLAMLVMSQLTDRFGWPVHVEFKLGCARPDVIFHWQRDKPGAFTPVIIDVKYFDHIASEQVALHIAQKFAYDHQLLHYAWAYMQYTHMWHSPDDPMLYIGVYVTSTTPKPMGFLLYWPVTKARILQWLTVAYDTWMEMAIAHNAVKKNIKSCYGTVYGNCKMLRRCFGDIGEGQHMREDAQHGG